MLPKEREEGSLCLATVDTARETTNMLLITISLLTLMKCSREALAFSLIKSHQAVIPCSVRSPPHFYSESKFAAIAPLHSIQYSWPQRRVGIVLQSSYREFSDFDRDDDDEEEDDDDDDDYINLDDNAVAKFKAMMGIPKETTNLSEEDDQDDDDDDEYPEIIEDSDFDNLSSIEQLITFATTKSEVKKEAAATEWAKPVDISKSLTSGVCLVANPAKFCEDLATNGPPSLALLSKFGLTLPPPTELGPDRRADLLPVLILLDRHPLRGCHALLLNRRTGYLIGDLENQQFDSNDGSTSNTSSAPTPPNLGAFMIQPLWFGGTSSSRGGDQSSSGSSGSSSINGLDMIHLCPLVKGARQITEDGLFYGGDPVQAQEAMSDPSLERIMTGFDFKFFVQSTRWLPMQLEKEIRDGCWFVASVSKEVLFKSRDRLGAKRAKPLWTEIMELLGGEYKGIRDDLYGGD